MQLFFLFHHLLSSAAMLILLSAGQLRHGWACSAGPASHEDPISATMATGPAPSSMPSAGSSQSSPSGLRSSRVERISAFIFWYAELEGMYQGDLGAIYRNVQIKHVCNRRGKDKTQRNTAKN